MSFRPSRTIQPSTKLTAENGANLEPSAHRRVTSSASALVTQGRPITTATSTRSVGSSPSLSLPDSRYVDKTFVPTNKPSVKRSAHDMGHTAHTRASTPSADGIYDGAPASKKPKTLGPSGTRDDLGMHADVQVVDIDDASDPREETLNKTDATADIKEFFTPVDPQPGQTKVVQMRCKLCEDGRGCPKKEKVLTNEHTTLRRHAASFHRQCYRKWCKQNKFESMLPGDTKERRQAADNKNAQSMVTDHFKPQTKEDKPIVYSDKVFASAAIEWLIDADLPLQVFSRPSFKRMVDIASRAKRGIKLPSVKQTRGHIVKAFKEHMFVLKDRLNSLSVSGEVSLTCDAWQGANTDGYFAVTGHWIEENALGEWTEQHALLGFTQLNNAHNGTRLGQALYKVCSRLDIIHKIGHVTCDNAKNYRTMLQEFARCYNLKTGNLFDVNRRQIRCLAHVINLATQAVISTRSKSKYYSGDLEDDTIPEDVGTGDRDEIGIIRAICVKARSSSQQKQHFKTLQECTNIRPCPLLLDTKDRWSSTYIMLTRAESQRQAVDKFVRVLRLRETTLEKRCKIAALALTEEEWTRVRLFSNILQHADNSQQAFSASSRPTLHNVLPPLDKLCTKWEKASTKPRYEKFKPALAAGMAKLNEHYQRSAASDVHLIVMVLNPTLKMNHFKKWWSPNLISEVEDAVRACFVQRYKDLHQDMAPISTRACKGTCHRNTSRWNIDDTDSESDDDMIDPSRPWLDEWDTYVNTHEVVPEGMEAVHWWGIHGQRYPTWRSLARDYLAIMAFSVSSESAFSAAGITINKHRNRLEGDVVEALQCLKSIINQDLIFREVVSATQEEVDLDLADQDPANHEANASEVVRDGVNWSWDNLVEGLEDEEEVLGLLNSA